MRTKIIPTLDQAQKLFDAAEYWRNDIDLAKYNNLENKRLVRILEIVDEIVDSQPYQEVMICITHGMVAQPFNSVIGWLCPVKRDVPAMDHNCVFRKYTPKEEE